MIAMVNNQLLADGWWFRKIHDDEWFKEYNDTLWWLMIIADDDDDGDDDDDVNIYIYRYIILYHIWSHMS